jgi:uncharacterized membrane protein
MSAHMAFLLVRLLHVVTATLWVGAAVTVAASIAPAVRATGSAGATVLRHLMQIQRLPYAVIALGLIAILSGAYLMWEVSNGAVVPWSHTASGRTYLVGAASALTAGLIGGAVNIPLASRIAAIAGQANKTAGAPTTEQSDKIRHLSDRLILGARVVAVLLVVATSSMAVARYL